MLVFYILAKYFINNKINKNFIAILCRVVSIWRKAVYMLFNKQWYEIVLQAIDHRQILLQSSAIAYSAEELCKCKFYYRADKFKFRYAGSRSRVYINVYMKYNYIFINSVFFFDISFTLFRRCLCYAGYAYFEECMWDGFWRSIDGCFFFLSLQFKLLIWFKLCCNFQI